MQMRKNDKACLQEREGQVRFGAIRCNKYIYVIDILPVPDTVPEDLQPDFDENVIVCKKVAHTKIDHWPAYGPFSHEVAMKLYHHCHLLGIKPSEFRLIEVDTGIIYALNH